MANSHSRGRNTHLQKWETIKGCPHGQRLLGSRFAAPKPAHSCLIGPYLTSQLPCTTLGTPETAYQAALSIPPGHS